MDGIDLTMIDGRATAPVANPSLRLKNACLRGWLGVRHSYSGHQLYIEEELNKINVADGR